MARTPERQTAVGTLAALSRHRGPDDPAVVEARSEVAQQKMLALIRAAPPLTSRQVDELVRTLYAHGALESQGQP